MLKNTGNVPVHFCYEPHNTQNLRFTFSPTEGEIPVGNEIPISVRFEASEVRQFNEIFHYKLRGVTQNHPYLEFVGKVIGPSFQLFPRHIDFGTVSYGFLHTKTFEIENKSAIPFEFTLRVIQEGKESLERREIQLHPEFGIVDKHSKFQVTIEFIPISLQNYNFKILFDIARFGKHLSEISINANCLPPILHLIPDIIDLKKAFIGYTYSETIQVENQSSCPAKIEFIQIYLYTKF